MKYKKIAIKITLTITTIVICAWVLTRPNIFRPLSEYSAYDEGFKRGYGSYPKNCPSMMCIAHGGGFWYNFFRAEKDSTENQK